MSPRKKFAQLSLFAQHRHCTQCGVVTHPPHEAFCEDCAPPCVTDRAKFCPICQAEPGNPCKTEAGHVLPFEHADRISATEYVERVRAGRV